MHQKDFERQADELEYWFEMGGYNDSWVIAVRHRFSGLTQHEYLKDKNEGAKNSGPKF